MFLVLRLKWFTEWTMNLGTREHIFETTWPGARGELTSQVKNHLCHPHSAAREADPAAVITGLLKCDRLRKLLSSQTKMPQNLCRFCRCASWGTWSSMLCIWNKLKETWICWSAGDSQPTVLHENPGARRLHQIPLRHIFARVTQSLSCKNFLFTACDHCFWSVYLATLVPVWLDNEQWKRGRSTGQRESNHSRITRHPVIFRLKWKKTRYHASFLGDVGHCGKMTMQTGCWSGGGSPRRSVLIK